MKARVCWSIKGSSYIGRGECLEQSIAEAWVSYGNKTWPDILHWTEACYE